MGQRASTSTATEVLRWPGGARHLPQRGERVLRTAGEGGSQRDLITVLGHAAMISAGQFVQASGAWQNDRTHGVQFRASPRCGQARAAAACRRSLDDSPPEQNGFELSVPPLRPAEFRKSAQVLSRDDDGRLSRGRSVHGGTEISNLVRSSRESAANRAAAGELRAMAKPKSASQSGGR